MDGIMGEGYDLCCSYPFESSEYYDIVGYNLYSCAGSLRFLEDSTDDEIIDDQEGET